MKMEKMARITILRPLSPERRGPRWKLIPLVLFLAFLAVEGNSEIESCLRVLHNANTNSGGGGGATNSRLLGDGVNSNSVGGSASSNSGSSDKGEHSQIVCHIRTLHPDLDVENLTSSIPSGNGGNLDAQMITKLKLVCNDVLFFESGVSPGQLSSLSELHELNIEKCKLKHLPADFLSGLRHLRKLTINTGNSDWAARSLEISPGAFSQVSLRYLHLGSNHIWSLPNRLLCQLDKLTSLNLTRNLLSDIDDLGLPGNPIPVGRALPLQNQAFSTPSSNNLLGDACLSELKTLDLSFNSLRTLGFRRLERLKKLQHLQVDNNWLEELEDDVFAGLESLKVLNLSSNRLVALPAKLFQSTKLVEQLDLRNNSLTALAPGLLNSLEHLLVLDLSRNSLSSQWITAEAFQSLIRLRFISLSYNQLTHLDKSTFQYLYSVQSLDLSNNLISSIDDGTFASMKNLYSLNLARNRLVNVNDNMFNGLFVLHKLSLDYNTIEKIEPTALQNCTSLSDLGLVGNKLTSIPEAVRNLQRLTTLDIGENRISKISNSSFQGLTQIYGIRLVDNNIEEIPQGFCDSTPRLRVFNVAHNKITKIASSAFISCPELKVLRLDSNKLEIIPSTLKAQLPSLLWLNVSTNFLKIADYSLLPATVEFFDVSYNQLETLGGAATIKAKSTESNRIQQNQGHHNARLRVVDASHNHLTQLDYNAVPPGLEILRLSHNRLRKIHQDTFSRSSHIRRVELISNQLENIPLNALRLPPIPAGRQLPEFFLGGNPFLCDCEMEWLTRINQLSALRQHPTVLDLDAIVCRVSYSRTVTHIPLPDIKPQDFLCPYKSHCFALCHCCDFDACDCEMTCPSNCTCYHDDTWTANVVNCASTGHTAIPGRLPMDSTEIYLDGNNIPQLKSHTFIGRKNLRILFLNSSRIDTISNKSFNGLQSLQSLHLEGNFLKVLNGYEFDHLSRLRELYLQDNFITTISNTTFLPLKSLEILRIDGNRIVTFAVWQLSLNPYLVEISLARNLWNCDCEYLHQFYGWISDNSRKLVDLNQLQCVWNTTQKPGPHLIDYNRTCGSSWALMGIDGGFGFTTFTSPLPLILGFVCLALFLVSIVILVVACRDNVRLWIFSFFGVRMCAPDFDDEKLYDSYLIYSQKDEEFVAQRIADELETNDSYRLCLHYRDLLSETGDLKEMMVGAVENSKSVVIILSRNFLQGEWTSGEYRGSFHAVLKKSKKSDSKKVVIVFIDDIPPMDVNPDIRSWVRHNNIQVIKWSLSTQDGRKERKFWSKLKYSLPPPSSHYHSNITSNTTTATSNTSPNETGIMATLKYGENDHQHIIVDEMNRTITMNINNKLWPYAQNLVALPSKYHQPQSPSSHTGTLQSHLSLNNYNQSPVHQQTQHYNTNPHHYHPPLPLSNPPKSPPSSQSTDSTTTTNGDGEQGVHTPTSFSLMFQQMQQQHKSPLPVPKSLYNNTPTTNNTSANHGGESYLSLEQEHVYSTLDCLQDPPSPQGQQQNNRSMLNNIHLPNGYTYQPQITMASHPHLQQQQHPTQQGQWHPSLSTPKGTLNFASKSYKQKDGTPVQTYLV